MSKQEQFWLVVKEHNLENTIVDLIQNQSHSMSMVIDMLMQQYPHIIQPLLPLGASTRSRILRLKNLTVSSDYNTKPQNWKLQYRYSEKQIMQQCKQGGVLASKIRKQKTTPYNPPQSVDHWLQLGYSLELAETKATEFKRNNSPRCYEFWLRRGLTKEEAIDRIKIQSVNGALACLKKTQQPSTEKQVAKFLREHNIVFTTQLRVNNFGLLDGRSVFVYDFCVSQCNLLLEINGTYWHADKTVFGPEDELKFPGGKIFKAKEIWRRDEMKRQAAENAGYSTATIWELELKDEKWKQNLLKLIASKTTQNMKMSMILK